MKRKHVLQLLAMLGAERITESSEWVRASCLFAPWKHGRGTDSRPSFGISIGKQSHYFCFSCQSSGQLTTLVTALCMLKGKDHPEARKFVMDHEDLSMEPYEDLEKDSEPLSVLSTSLISKFFPATEDMEFVRKRRLTAETLRLWAIRYDSSEKRLVLPVFNSRCQLVGFKGRTTNGSDIKYREYSELQPKRQSLKGNGIWFGMSSLPAETHQKLILVEGELDAIKLSQALKYRRGIWASMGASIADEQIKTLLGTPNPVLLFLDNDEAGHAARDKIITRLRRVKPGISVIDDYCGCKDPDEIVDKGKLKQALASIRQVG